MPTRWAARIYPAARGGCFAVQTANDASKPIGVVFGLVGFYLGVGKAVFGSSGPKNTHGART